MSDLEPKEAGDYCNARKTQGDGYCQHEAGWGTDHTGHGRCRFHGGNTPDQEKHVLDELEDAAEHASTALRLQMKHLLARIEDPEEDVDAGELDRLARTVLDRTGYGPTEKRELEATVDGEISHDTPAEFVDYEPDTNE